MMRLQKYMAEAGIGSRRACEELISQGRVMVNGQTAALGSSVEPGVDIVEYNGEIVGGKQPRVVIAYNKPQGVICSNDDPQGRVTIADVFKAIPYRLYNVGRLDYDSEGLVLITNDGELANLLTHPRYMVRKTYFVICDGELTNSQRLALQNGVELEDGMTAPSIINAVKPNRLGNTSFLITIREGRNRQVRRMVEAVEHRTLLLRRIRMGTVELGDMPTGEWRYLSDAELAELDSFLSKLKA